MTTENFEKRTWKQSLMRKPECFELDEIEESKLADEDMRLTFAVWDNRLPDYRNISATLSC
jgi:hypothetical protein